MSEPQPSVVSLNDVSRLLAALTSGDLRTQLGLAAGGGLRADCDIRCGCNTRDCACHGGVSARGLVDEVSLPEFEAMRAQRLQDLKEQIARLERG
jgi:hypothetical protein